MRQGFQPSRCGASQVNQYLISGRYIDAAMAMLRQIRHSFGV
jgi:hypothetical protein